MAQSSSGKTCKTWAPPYNTSYLYEADDVKANYCRNPGGLRNATWCFVDNTPNGWEYCDLPQCGTRTPQDLKNPFGGKLNTNSISTSSVNCISIQTHAIHAPWYRHYFLMPIKRVHFIIIYLIMDLFHITI